MDHPFVIHNDTDHEIRVEVLREHQRVDVVVVEPTKNPVVTNDEGLFTACVLMGLIPNPNKAVQKLKHAVEDND